MDVDDVRFRWHPDFVISLRARINEYRTPLIRSHKCMKRNITFLIAASFSLNDSAFISALTVIAASREYTVNLCTDAAGRLCGEAKKLHAS